MTKKTALVTGGSRGLGKDMALALARKGLHVVLTYREKKNEAEEVVKEIIEAGGDAICTKLDVSDIKTFDTFLAEVRDLTQRRWGTERFDFLINNAGIGATVPMADVTEDLFDNFVNVHYKGVYFLTQRALPFINDGGGIIFISSGTTRFCNPGYSVYASLKGAIEVLSRYVAKEFGSRKIRSNVVAPGAIETDFNNATIRNNPQLKSFLASQTALGRVGEATDIGSVVAFLCTDEAGWINAQRIEVSGGMFI
jgi:NAD(P)-dependent dehydrogenase (short-subunit alcohol dehydrogenase family)